MKGLLTSKKSGNNNVEKELLNNLLNNSKIIKSFSVPKEDVSILAAFIEISRREDGNLSKTIVKAMKEYVHRHRIPNPQARLDRMLALGLPHKPSWQCCVPNCRGKALYELRLKDFQGKTELFPVCGAHKRWKHPKFRFLLGYKELTKV